jgi:2-desacetyl-2-hydroxyethyl bacteriochlorophyllide A dehydrogenase
MPGSRRSLTFVAPRSVGVRDEPLPAPHAGQVLVETLVSAISPGTELLVYRGRVPAGMPLDSTISELAGPFAYPLKYGYAAVGRIVALGADVGRDWLGQLVVGFHPHESHFVAAPGTLLRVPPGVTAEAAAFLPSAETAVTLLMDGQPIVGERVAVFGQGLVGLLCAALLARFPLAELVTLDRHPMRRTWSTDLGADRCLDPAAGEIERLRSSFDLTYELSGNPAVLDDAIGVTGFDGRVVIGSWYGDQPATVALGGTFHRSRIRLISSQVSTIAPRWSGRWSKARRLGVAWRMLAEIEPTRLITHRFPLSRAAEAYDLLDRRPDEAVAVLLTYEAPCTSA